MRRNESLRLVSIRSGLVQPQPQETGAEASSSLDTQQRAVEIGEPVPIVFGRWRNGVGGGVFISPVATEARFENDSNNNVTAYYHLAISEGEIDGIQVRDVYQRSCRVGTHTQTYSRRAGTWVPGNFIVQRPEKEKPECPTHCGSIGTYPGISTLSFNVTIPDGFDQWNRQVHLFIRGGMHVTRLYDSTVGPSDNFADLVLWMLSNNGRVPSTLIDTAALSSAATFLEVNGLTCNCWLTESRNYADLLADWAPMFLLYESSNEGKRGLRPLLPVNGDGTINTGVIDWEYIFTENTILPGTFEIEYSSLSDRLPFVVQIMWRQELGYDAAIIRTAEVRYAGTTESGPYESHDMSAFCTQENHAVKVGAYILARRTHSTHTIRFSARPQSHNRSLTVGDIVRVKLARMATAAAPSYHDHLYQIERITKTLAGDVSYECSHFPIDEQGRSVIAVEVDAAQGDGVLLSGNRTGVSCDDGDRWNNETVPDEFYIEIGGVLDPNLDDWPTTPDGGYEPWPLDPNGYPAPWPTDGSGNPLIFDPDDLQFDPWNNDDTLDPWDNNNDGLPDIELTEDGIPEMPLDPDGLPIDSGLLTATLGGGIISLPNSGSGSSGGTPADDPDSSPSDSPDDDSTNADDGKDDPVDDPYFGWPDGYPTPSDPDYPAGLPTETDPNSGNSYVAPVNDPSWPLGDQPGKNVYFVQEVGGSRTAYFNYPSCTTNTLSPLVSSETRTLVSGGIKAVYAVYGAAGQCGGVTLYSTKVLKNNGDLIGLGWALGYTLNGAEVDPPSVRVEAEDA